MLAPIMRYLVTGAAGFVGRAIVRRILAEGDEAHALVRDRGAAEDLAEAGATVHEGTVGDPNGVAEAARGAHVLVHCAAVSSHRAARRALRWTNVAGTENVVNAAKHAGCERLVHVSCADVTLCNEDRVHWNEDRELSHPPLDEHARTKLLAEELAMSANGSELEVVSLRPALLWGPGDRTHLPALVREAQASGGAIRLVGSGENLLATTYIDNFVEAVMSACEVTKAAGRIYYVVDGDFLDAREFFDQLSRAVGVAQPKSGPPYPLAYALALARQRMGSAGWWPTDVIHRGKSTQFDAQRAMNDLDWEPHTSVAEGMKALAAWAISVGGPDAIASMYRPPATSGSVDADVAAAGGDTLP